MQFARKLALVREAIRQIESASMMLRVLFDDDFVEEDPTDEAISAPPDSPGRAVTRFQQPLTPERFEEHIRHLFKEAKTDRDREHVRQLMRQGGLLSAETIARLEQEF